MAKLYFYHGPMNSSKSAQLIMQVHSLRSKGYRVSVYKPSLDTRDSNFIKSRALSTKLEFIPIDDDLNFYRDVIPPIAFGSVDYIFIDEANFLSPEIVDEFAKIVDKYNIPVFAYGLMRDYKGKLFEGSKRLVELADSIREISSPCKHCQKKATMHLRKINDEYVFNGESIQVGDMDSYESVCRSCYYQAFDKSK